MGLEQQGVVNIPALPLRLAGGREDEQARQRAMLRSIRTTV
jgi:hypothetical protein